MEAVRALVEATTLPQRDIAARVGVCRDTVSNLRVRHGWQRPGVARLRGQSESRNPLVADLVEAARALVEGSIESECAIARRLGLDRQLLHRWRKRHGWRRPAGAPTFLPGPRADGRARPARYRTMKGKPYAADAVEGARTLLTATLLSQKEIAERLGVSQGWVGQLLRRRGWERPPACHAPGAARTAPLATEGDRRGRPYAPSVRREARALWELSLLPTALIAARLGCCQGTVSSWARAEAWDRPRGRSTAKSLRAYFGRQRAGRP